MPRTERRFAFRVFRGVVEAMAPQPTLDLFSVPFVNPQQAEWEYDKLQFDLRMAEDRRRAGILEE